MMREPDFVDECYADKDLSLLKKLTLVIPTYNRNYYLSRCLWYHAHFPFGEIIVADSSPEEKKVVNRETVQKVREMFGANVRYLEYEPETEKYGGDIYRKWGDAVQHVETEYSQIVTDKEFLIPTSLIICIHFLMDNQEYSICEGEDYMMKYDHENQIAFYQWQGKTSFIQNSAYERILAYINDPSICGTQFAIHRTTIHKKIFRNLLSFDLCDIRFGETAIEIQPLLFEKTRRLPEIGNIRDSITTINNEEGSSFMKYPFLVNYPNDLYQDKLNKLIHCIRVTIEKSEGIQHNESEYKLLVSELIGKRYIASSPILRKSNLLLIIWNMLPTICKKIISNSFGSGLADLKPVSDYNDEMMCVISTIKQHKNSNIGCIDKQ